MEIVKDQHYGSMASMYQLLEIDRLNRVLLERGIQDQATRHWICHDYFFANGLFLDADGESFTWQGKQLHPVLGFAKRGMTERESPIETLHLEDHANLYWSAEANLNKYFNKLNEDISGIKKELGLWTA